MKRKHLLINIIAVVAVCTLLINVSYISCWESGEMRTSNSGDEPPTIDGSRDNLWLEENVNVSFNPFSKSQATLRVFHHQNQLFILLEIEYQTFEEEEQFSIYISSSNTTTATFTDKKQLIMYNASEKGNETSEFKDLHKSGDDYIEDNSESSSEGVAAYGPGVKRYYEFNISRSATNATENTNITIGESYAFKVEYKSGDGTEEVSDPLIIQVGPRVTEQNEEIGEFNLDWTVFSEIVHWIVFGLLCVFGIMIFRNYSKIVSLKNDVKKYQEES